MGRRRTTGIGNKLGESELIGTSRRTARSTASRYDYRDRRDNCELGPSKFGELAEDWVEHYVMISYLFDMETRLSFRLKFKICFLVRNAIVSGSLPHFKWPGNGEAYHGQFWIDLGPTVEGKSLLFAVARHQVLSHHLASRWNNFAFGIEVKLNDSVID